MSFLVQWEGRALVQFYRADRATATVVDRAVVLFADGGIGEIEHDAPYYLLRAGRFDVVLSIVHETRTLFVLRFYRAR